MYSVAMVMVRASRFACKSKNKIMCSYSRYAFILFMLLFNKAAAQIIDARACDSIDRFFVTEQMSVLKSKTNLTIESVLQKTFQNKFEKCQKSVVS
jgi:hypothetical protein